MQRIVKNSAVGAMCVSVGVSAMRGSDPIDLTILSDKTALQAGNSEACKLANEQFADFKERHDSHPKEDAPLSPEQQERLEEVQMIVEKRSIILKALEDYRARQAVDPDFKIGAGDEKKKVAEMSDAEIGVLINGQLDLVMNHITVPEEAAETVAIQGEAPLGLAPGNENIEGMERILKDPDFVANREFRIKFMKEVNSAVQPLVDQQMEMMEGMTRNRNGVHHVVTEGEREEQATKRRKLEKLVTDSNKMHLGLFATTNGMIEALLDIKQMALVDYRGKGQEITDQDRIDRCARKLDVSNKNFGNLMEYVIQTVDPESLRPGTGKHKAGSPKSLSREGSVDANEEQAKQAERTQRTLEDVKAKVGNLSGQQHM